MNFELLYDDDFSEIINPLYTDELRQFLQKKHGWIYIAQSGDNTVFKIGRTGKSPYARAKSLSSTGVLNDYEIIFSLEVFNQFYVEKLIHKLLKKYRVNKEFFSVSLDVAVSAAKKACEKEEALLGRFLNLSMVKEDIELLPYALKKSDRLK